MCVTARWSFSFHLAAYTHLTWITKHFLWKVVEWRLQTNVRKFWTIRVLHPETTHRGVPRQHQRLFATFRVSHLHWQFSPFLLNYQHPRISVLPLLISYFRVEHVHCAGSQEAVPLWQLSEVDLTLVCGDFILCFSLFLWAQLISSVHQVLFYQIDIQLIRQSEKYGVTVVLSCIVLALLNRRSEIGVHWKPVHEISSIYLTRAGIISSYSTCVLYTAWVSHEHNAVHSVSSTVVLLCTLCICSKYALLSIL